RTGSPEYTDLCSSITQFKILSVRQQRAHYEARCRPHRRGQWSIAGKGRSSWKPPRRSGRGSWPTANVSRRSVGCPRTSYGNSRTRGSFASFYPRHTVASTSHRGGGGGAGER